MRKTLPALAALLVLYGCGSSEGSSSVLQRYDRMRRELRWITGASTRVSDDVTRLRGAMARAQEEAVRRDAVRLKLDARQFGTRSGAAGNSVRTLAQDAPTKTVHLYLLQVTDVLTWDWVEGLALTYLGDQAWADPLSVRGNSTQRLSTNLGWAQRAAYRAVRAAAAARAIKNHARSQFRYVVVTPAN